MAVITILVMLFFIAVSYDFAIKNWRRTQMDSCRDSLFALRDELREYFVVNNLNMDSAIYKHTRDLLNAHLQYMDVFSFDDIYEYNQRAVKNPEVYKIMSDEINNRFVTDNTELQKLIQSIRYQSTMLIKDYAINKNFLLWTMRQFIEFLLFLKINSSLLGFGRTAVNNTDSSSIEKISYINAKDNNYHFAV